MGMMKPRVMAAFVAAAFMVVVGSFGADAQRRGSSIDDWLGFDQSDDSWEQPMRDRAFQREWETQPERGFPTLAKENIATTKTAIKQYAEIVARGGWPQLPPIELRTGMSHPAVVQLRTRLQVTGDLQAYGGYPEVFDSYVEQAVKRAQERHGIPPTGFLDQTTIEALNVPASARLRQLRTNLARLQSLVPGTPAGKYVIVNIPAAQIEAVNNNQVISRHAGVVGKPDRPSPLLNSAIEEINFNKEWVVPPTVLKYDLVPKGRGGQDVLAKYKIDAYATHEDYQKGKKLDASQIDWSSDAPLRYFYVQAPGDENPLGFAKINFASPQGVYMHDTPGQSVFQRSFRADSSGCIRVQNIHQLVAWLLEDNGWSVQQVLRMKQSGERLFVRLKKRVPLYWTYITAWSTPDGTVQFRRDIYRKDGVEAIASAY
ncbi:Peptidoglycan-binding domain 1 protein [Rhodomicrobium vannielii ATCC 17100]|uniref:Peptidoglycan-binding domain 1 protein n=2 Tax=Rhodomicrobium vannielii TaxID=1069 RepID=E3I576_RHOVT|nr:Peptidoglycan-binding domain 1 protein [Rhodomicrobium vannielii ATCC 17100]